MQNKAISYFKEGYSCSEAIVQAAIDMGLASKELLPVATSFSGGMSSGCLCGAVAASQMVIGAVNGKIQNERDGKQARQIAAKFIEEFKKRYNTTCCRSLTSQYEFTSPERREHCADMVLECTDILINVLDLEKEKV